MLFYKFLSILLAWKAVLAFHGFNGDYGKPCGGKQLEHHLRSIDHERSEKDSRFTHPVKINRNRGESAEDDATERTVLLSVEPTPTVKDGLVKDVPDERSKNGSDVALPLHVTNTARQQCLDGYQADQNGICQKTMQPKNDKSFKLKRRKRAEQTATKLSYADVVKYGRNPPKELLTTAKAEIFTEKPDIATVPATTTFMKRIRSRCELNGTDRRDPVTTIRIAPATQKPGVIAAPATTSSPTTTPPKCKFYETDPRGPVTTIRIAQPTQKPAVIAEPTTLKPATPASVASKTAKPVAVITAPPVVAKFTNKPSISGDINQDFLLGEKSSVVSQSMDGKVKPVAAPVSAKKTVDPTRLRRWIRFV